MKASFSSPFFGVGIGMTALLTHARLRELLNYDPETGRFTWRVSTNKRIVVSERAGHVDDHNGYRRIGIDGTQYRAGRLAFCLMTGKLPANDVDHINGIRDDDRWINLREANDSQNVANSPLYSGKRVPLKGVSLKKGTRRYSASLTKDYRKIHLGYFDSAEDAHAAYVVAARKYFGEFARAK
jgi:hypothetical protein